MRDHGELFLLLRAIWTICLAHSPAGNLQGCQPQPIREDNGIVNCKNTLEQHVQLCIASESLAHVVVTLGTKPHATLLDLTDENEDEESCSIDNFGKQWVLRDGNVELIIFASLMRWLASGAPMKANHRRRENSQASSTRVNVDCADALASQYQN